MFKWGRTSNKAAPAPYEPRTPKLANVSLPDERYTPISHQPVYSEKPHKSFLRRFTPDRRATTPMYESWKQPSHEAPYTTSGRSRSRTVSTPARQVEAPRPIRPHPSQGPFIPVMERGDRIRTNPSPQALAPVGVPSAQYLEDQLGREQSDPARRVVDLGNGFRGERVPPDFDWTPYVRVELPESWKKKPTPKKHGHGPVHAIPSKAWLEDQEEKVRNQAPSAPPMKKASSKSWADEPLGQKTADLDEWKPVPVVDDKMIIPDTKGIKIPLKPALKKTSSIKPPAPKPILKAREYSDSKAYHSESEMENRRSESDPRKPDWPKPPRVVKAPSKAYLEEQQEKLEEMQRGWASRNQQPAARPVPVHELPPSAFQYTSSGSTGSPTDSLAHEYHRSCRTSHTEPRPQPSNYMPAYIKEGERVFSSTWPSSTPHEHPFSLDNYIPQLSWPLVDYVTRKHHPYPLVYFDAGFNPRHPRYQPTAKREPGHKTPLTPEEKRMVFAGGAFMPYVVITNRVLASWPVYIRKDKNIEVFDVFQAIYDTYSQPLTMQEKAHIGEEYLERCRRSFLQRCEDSPEATHIVERIGIARIDLLRGRRIFKGLVYSRGQPLNHFELFFDDGH